MKRGIECFGHVHRDKVPQEDHHIKPQEFGGQSVAENMARGCANAHSDTHYFLNLLLKYYGHVPWDIEREFGPKVRGIAQRGYNEIKKDEALLEATRLVAIARLDGAPSHEHEYAWRRVSEAIRGCPFGTHAPTEPHHYSCWLHE